MEPGAEISKTVFWLLRAKLQMFLDKNIWGGGGGGGVTEKAEEGKKKFKNPNNFSITINLTIHLSIHQQLF